MKRIAGKTYATGILALLMMVIIFFFSSQTAEESTRVSSGLLTQMIGWFRPLIEGVRGMPCTDIELETVLRKLGHFSEYAVLGMLCHVHLRCTRRRLPWLWAWGIATLYAMTDELHQLVSDGRAASVTDVQIDSMGALTGILVLKAVARAARRARRIARGGKDAESA